MKGFVRQVTAKAPTSPWRNMFQLLLFSKPVIRSKDMTYSVASSCFNHKISEDGDASLSQAVSQHQEKPVTEKLMT